ncbi:hypothetical protein TSUD_368900 [Trifolium subterraneum]|uniref:Uncharacterized protein n=1 Tax=Trifolium subterraneum TaxID=3900 RepID=A0A2Z6NHT0_TRISU|nr:hypothetical protein TSUD_368900 [Trifolium subterraneum]
MALHNVQDEISHGDIHTQDFVIEEIENDKVEHKMPIDDEGIETDNSCVASEAQLAPTETKEEYFDNDVQTNTTLNDASSYDMPETTQNVVIVQDDGFVEVVKAHIQVLKQIWVDMEEIFFYGHKTKKSHLVTHNI